MSCFNCYGDHREPECQALCRFCLYYPRNVPHNCAAVRMRYPRSVFQKYFARAKQENRLSTFELSQEARVEIERIQGLPDQQLEMNTLLREAFGCFNARSTAAVIREVVLPRLQVIENRFMTSGQIFVRHGSTTNLRGQALEFTEIFVPLDDRSDAAALLKSMKTHDFIRVQLPSRLVTVSVRRVQRTNAEIVLEVDRVNGYDPRVHLQIAEVTVHDQLRELAEELESSFDRVTGANPEPIHPEWLGANVQSVFEPSNDLLYKDVPSRVSARLEQRVRTFIDRIDYGVDRQGQRIRLTEAEIEAVIKIVQKELVAIEGPPGTGKTTVICTAAEFLWQELHEKVLLISSNNFSADLMALKLFGIHEQIDPNGTAAVLNSPWEYMPISRHYAQHFSEEDVDPQLVNKRLFSKCHEDIKLKSVTICTAGHLSNQAVSNFRATALIVDEAGLITYAETLSILLRRAFGSDYFRSCALVGDPRQLRPVFTQRSMLLDQELNKRGMNLSGIEVVINLGATTVLLNESHRGPRDCFSFAFSTWYADEVTAIMEHSDFDVFQFAPFSGLRNTLGPVHSVFVAPAGSREEDAGTSFVNRANAAFGLHFIRSVEAHAPNTPITYIAIYAAQKTYVEQQLRLYNVRNVVVVTADEYQVYEQEVVLVDTVRTDMPGFLRGISREHGDGRAFNGRLVVATTRAKKAMVVIGSYFGMHMAGDLWRLYTYYEDRRRAFHWDGARAILSQITQDIRNRLIAAQGGRPSATRAGV